MLDCFIEMASPRPHQSRHTLCQIFELLSRCCPTQKQKTLFKGTIIPNILSWYGYMIDVSISTELFRKAMTRLRFNFCQVWTMDLCQFWFIVFTVNPLNIWWWFNQNTLILTQKGIYCLLYKEYCYNSMVLLLKISIVRMTLIHTDN